MSAKYNYTGIKRLASEIIRQVVDDVEKGEAFSKAVEVFETPFGESIIDLLDLNVEEIKVKLESGNFKRGQTRAIYRRTSNPNTKEVQKVNKSKAICLNVRVTSNQ